MLSITKIFHFEASHQLERSSQCPSTLHGHSYTLEVTLSRHHPESTVNHTIEDTFSLTDFVHKHLLSELNNRHLNDVLELSEPTLEVFIRDIQTAFEHYLPTHLLLQSLKLGYGDTFVQLTMTP